MLSFSLTLLTDLRKLHLKKNHNSNEKVEEKNKRKNFPHKIEKLKELKISFKIIEFVRLVVW